MADGIAKAFQDYFESLGSLGDKAVEALKEQIDIDTDIAQQDILAGVPEKSGGLKASLTKSEIQNPAKYGYILEFKGEDKNGVPYEKIANILNSGTAKIRPRKFLTKAVKKLKGLDRRAAERFIDKAGDD